MHLVVMSPLSIFLCFSLLGHFLKNLGGLFCSTSLSLGLSDVSSASGHALFKRTLHTEMMQQHSQCIISGGTRYLFAQLLVVLTLITR